MFKYAKKDKGVTVNERSQEFVANTYVMRCFTVTMIVYLTVFLLNQMGVFIIEKVLMWKAFIPSAILYVIARIIANKISLSDKRTKYLILFCTITVFTITGVYLSYHAILLLALPLLYATPYSSKQVMRYVFCLTIVSAFVSVYTSYYVGLCDANMLLLTAKSSKHYIADGLFTVSQINENPLVTLGVFYVLPRCLICFAIMFVCNSIVEIISGSHKKTEQMFIQTVTALSEAVDAKDRYTSGHAKRVAEYARKIAQRLGKTEEEQDEIYRAGLLHDVGKIRIPEDIINKTSKLTDEEYSIIKIHPVTGYHILHGISEESNIAIAARYHHERYDGKGYPNGLEGEEIPEVARILGVADAYDAMASNRSYRKALPQEVVRSEIEKGKGTQFDPGIADIMLEMIDMDKEYRLKETDSLQKKILTVDNEEENNEWIKSIMNDEPRYEVISVSNGAEALAILTEQHIDLILLDVIMPEMDGLETLRQIREQLNTPVVLINEEKHLDNADAFRELGCEEFITKPVQPLLIKEVIHNMTEGTNL